MRTLPKLYAQRDPAWAAQRLGSVDGSTIGQYGCYITSFAMLACYYGHEVTPAQLDDLFTNNKIYVSGDLCPDDGFHKAFTDCVYMNTDDYASQPADLGVLKSLLADPTVSIILELDFDHNPNDGVVRSHFVVAVDCDGTKVTIADPWYNEIADFTKEYGNDPKTTILKYVVYKGTPIVATVPAGSTPMPNMYTMKSGHQVDLGNPDSMKVCADVFDDVMYNGVYIKKDVADAECTARLSEQSIALSTATDTIKNYVNNQNQILQILGLKTTDGQPEIVGALNGVLTKEQAFGDANQKILDLQGQIKQDAIDKQKALDGMQQQITDLEIKQDDAIQALDDSHANDITLLKQQQADEIAKLKLSCTNLGTSIASTVTTQETVNLIQRILNSVKSIFNKGGTQ